MVPGVIAGHYGSTRCTIDLGFARAAPTRSCCSSSASLVSPDANEVACSDGTVLPYDVLSIDVGSQPAIGAREGVERHAVLLRPSSARWSDGTACFARAAAGEVGTVTVVGGGAAGIEIALAMRHRFDVALRDERAARARHLGRGRRGSPRARRPAAHARMRRGGRRVAGGMPR
jgi:selenide,water dikinase